MEDFEKMRALIGDTLTIKDLEYVDCYVWDSFGLFIPFADGCGYAARQKHTHPSYMITLLFREEEANRYQGVIYSPDVAHNDDLTEQYYCIMIGKEYFEKNFLQYDSRIPYFENRSFFVCKDILKVLNLFAFEYSKNMLNSDITLKAQATILTHWLIRSILGESFDMRGISSDYAVAKCQHFIERHYQENITVQQLADMCHVSESGLHRRFQAELSMSPIEYLLEIRMAQAKKMLRRKEGSVTEIALKTGFGSSSHFSARFQKTQHLSPTEYRKIYVDS